ncbi:MAG: hypothetical protein K5663_00235 [Clostridiales bacterium]|nr:hypothetical protein [Clostridiales bacterium]
MPDILISGFRSSELTAGAAQALENCENIILHTARCPLAAWLQEKGKAFRSLDRLYDEAEDFDTHIKLVLGELEKHVLGLFCVMSVWDEAARAYARRHPAVKVLGGGSFAPLEVRSAGRICSSSAQDIRGAALPALSSVLVSEIDSREIAGEVKLALLDAYGDEAEVFFMDPEGQVIHLACENLDRLKHYDHRCACLVNPPAEPFRHDMESLEKLAENMCGPGEEMPCENTLPLAKSLADVIKYYLACRRHGYDPAWDIFDRAAEIIKKENIK